MPAAAPRVALGLALGLLGVIAFSLTLPMTRTAVAELDPWFVAFGRMSIAGTISALLIVATGVRRPAREDWPLVAWSAAGVVVGFPLFSSFAMKHIPANHGAIINGALPFATAVLAALAFGERHSRRFWLCAAAGSALVIAFALRGGAANAFGFGEAAMLAAVIIGAVGYVAGGRLSARLGGVAVILWALAVALPVTAPITLARVWSAPPRAGWAAWAAFGYVTLVSQLIGFFAWYNGMAWGGIARVGQVQLLQAFFTIGFAAALFGERVEPITWLFAAAVVATIAIGRTGQRTNA
ncbi:MAG: DMT family transporter [Burkholderiaceae bacterium]